MNATQMYEKLSEEIKSYGSVVLGFSGGVDSSLLAYMLKENDVPHVCVNVKTPLQKSGEAETAKVFCEEYGIEFDSIALDVLSVDVIRANTKDRCYHCKKTIFGTLIAYAKEKGYDYVLDGSNADDLFQYRPGLKAKDELGVKSPMADLGFTKRDVRELSHSLGLKTWDMPSSPCLATRIPYGNELDKGLLVAIDKAERILLNKDLANVRVRAHGDIARIEVKDIYDVFNKLDKADIDAIKACGFKFVCLDLEGYKRGCYD